MPVPEKFVRKIQEIRVFKLENSVFSKFKLDTPKVIDLACADDCNFSKIHRFVKDLDDRAAVFKMVKKYYSLLKDQFLSCIATKSYPVIDWMDFVSSCHKWKVIDSDLTSMDIDRIFIATNYEEEDLEDNEDNSLCRYEFMEIMCRMAKSKYCQSGSCKSVAEAV
jgi:hypothetical protein